MNQTVQAMTRAQFEALVSTRSLQANEVYFVDGVAHVATGVASARAVSSGAQNPTIGRTILTSGSYPLMTISDLTNMTYSQVAANLRSDGAGRAVRMATSAANGYGRVRLRTGRPISQNGDKIGVNIWVDPTHWNYNAGRVAPNMTIMVSADDVDSGYTNTRTLQALNNRMMPGWNRVAQRLDAGAATGGYGDWTVAGTMPADAQIRSMFVASSLTTAGDFVDVEQMDVGERGIPVFMFGFDGATFSTNALQQQVYDYMHARGVKGHISSRGWATVPEAAMQALNTQYQRGWDICQQGFTDRNWSTATAEFSTAATLVPAFRADWLAADAVLASRGWERGRRSFFSYPQNGFVNELNNVLLNEFGVQTIRVARTTAQNSCPGGKAITPFMNSIGIDGSGWTFAANGANLLRGIVDHGHVLCTTMHEVVADAATPSSIQQRISDVIRLIDLAVSMRDSGEALIMTPSEFNARFR